MAAIDAIVFAVAAGFAFAVLITIIVIIGIHREERRQTLSGPTPPGAMARLARHVLGWRIRENRDAAGPPYNDDRAAAFEHSGMTIGR